MMSRIVRVLLLAALSEVLPACEESGALTRTLGVTASRAGGDPAPELPESACTFLPIMLGSRVEERYPIAGPLAVVVSATRDDVEVHFEGAMLPAPSRTISTDTLSDGGSEQIDVISETGEAFVVVLTSPCGAGRDSG
jgi:hypothetical protein